MRAPEFWQRQSRSPWPTVLAPLGCLYAWAGRVRRLRTLPKRAPIPVVCVGNLVAGGAGKTPTVIAIVRLLRQMGIKVHVLSRGYGGRSRGPLRVELQRHTARDVGDEPLLLAREAPTWVARYRPAGAHAAMEAGAEILVMDDGHQNPTLHKDLSFVVIDSEFGVGNGRVIPAGPLREPAAEGLARADAIIVIGPVSESADHPDIRASGGGKPLLRAQIVPDVQAYALADKAVVAFAGIARPEKFFQTLSALGCHLVATHAFPDHQPFSAPDIMAMAEEAAQNDAVLVTTAKDATRLPEGALAMLQVVNADLEFADPAALERLLAPLCRRVKPAREAS